MPVEPESFSYDVKRAISQRYFGHDGTLGGSRATLTSLDIPYLEGVKDGGIRDIKEVIEAIRKYGAIEMWTQA